MYDDSDEEIAARIDEVLGKMDLIFKAVIYQGILLAVFIGSRLLS